MVKEKLMEKNDWQQRTELLLGEEKMNRIRKAHVLVVGLGGVGAYAAEMLCRTGVWQNDYCRCGHRAAYEYEPPVTCHALYVGNAESGSIGYPV